MHNNNNLLNELHREFDEHVREQKIEKIADGLEKVNKLLDDQLADIEKFNKFRECKKNGNDFGSLNLSEEEIARYEGYLNDE